MKRLISNERTIWVSVVVLMLLLVVALGVALFTQGKAEASNVEQVGTLTNGSTVYLLVNTSRELRNDQILREKGLHAYAGVLRIQATNGDMVEYVCTWYEAGDGSVAYSTGIGDVHPAEMGSAAYAAYMRVKATVHGKV